VVVGWNTAFETVFSVTGKSGSTAADYALTGVVRLRGYVGNLAENSTVNCLNNEEFFNQYSGAIVTAEGLKPLIYAADAGSTDSYAIVLSPPPTSYALITGVSINFKANTLNTGAATLNLNSLGAKTILKMNDQALATGDIEAGQIVTVVYDGTNFQMVSTSAVSATTGVSVADEDNAGSSSTTSSTFANITGADVSVVLATTSNVLLLASVQAYGNVDLASYAIQWHDGASVIGGPMQISLRSSNPRTTVVCNTVVVNATAGTKTYTLQHRSTDNTSSLTADAINTLAISIPSA